jgi:hypothetical protein
MKTFLMAMLFGMLSLLITPRDLAAQNCPVVPGDAGYAYLRGKAATGTADQMLREWMQAATVETLDSELNKLRDCFGARFGYQLTRSDHDFFNVSPDTCPVVYKALRCHQGLGWPLSRNPRATTTAPTISSFQSAKEKGYGALIDLANSSGCTSTPPPNLEECKKIDAAIVADVWSKLNCSSADASNQLCQNAIALNGKLGTAALDLKLPPKPAAAPQSTVNLQAANRCVTTTKDAMFGYIVNSCPEKVEVKFFDMTPGKACSSGCATGVAGGSRASINLYLGQVMFAACFSPTNPVGYTSGSSAFSCR